MENPDVTLQINSLTTYYKSETVTGSGRGSGSGVTSSIARTNALNDAKTNARNNTGYATVRDGGTVVEQNDLGFSVSGVTTSVTGSGTPLYISALNWTCSATASGSRTTKGYLKKINFTLPNNLTPSLIESATFKFYVNNFTGSAGDIFLICAPTNVEQDCFKKYSTASDVINTNISAQVEIDSDLVQLISLSGPIEIEVDITEVLQECARIGLGWFTLLYGIDAPVTSKSIDIITNFTDDLNSQIIPTIEIKYSYTKVNSPTELNLNKTIEIPGGSVVLSWTPASMTGVINNEITGYRIYLEISDSPVSPTLNSQSLTSIGSSVSSLEINVPANAIRGKYYNYAILTIGDKGPGGDSIISSYVSFRINTKPSVPIITGHNNNKIPSTGGSITFSVTPGNDIDTSLVKSVWFSRTIPIPGEADPRIEIDGSTLTLSFSASLNNPNVYFWTSDGLEYSDNYNLQIVTLNTAPTISDFDMIAVNTFSPAGTREYVKNISQTSINVTGNNLTYLWELCVGSPANTNIFDTIVPISTATSLSNIDVTAYGANFDTAYQLRLTVNDGIESVQKVSRNIFCIPPAPTILIYNLIGEGNLDGADYKYFGRYIRIKYSENNTGVTKKLLYKLNSVLDSTWTDLNLTGTGIDYDDVDLNILTRSNTYNFQVVFTCNSKTFATPSIDAEEGHETTRTTLTRAIDMTPANIGVTALTVTGEIKPYTNGNFTVDFNVPLNVNINENNYSSIYTTTSIEYGGRSLNITTEFSSKTGNTIITTWYLNDITTPNWITLINGSNSSSAPNASYNSNIKIIATNEFSETFTSTSSITLNFIEGISDLGTALLLIQVFKLVSSLNENTFNDNKTNYFIKDNDLNFIRCTNDSSYNSEIDYYEMDWENIPATYNGSINVDGRYPLFESQKIRLDYSNLLCYANQNVTIDFMSSFNNVETLIGTASISGNTSDNEWGAPGNNHQYTLNVHKYIEYIIPQNISSEFLKKNYLVKIALANKETGTITGAISNGSNLNSTFIARTLTLGLDTISTSFKILSIIESGTNNFNAKWECIDFGSFDSATKYSKGYQDISVQLIYSMLPNSGYTNLGNSISIKSSASKGSGNLNNILLLITADIIYIGAILTVILNFVDINSSTPTGLKTYTYTCLNLQTLYRLTPNLLYGKNFFAINRSNPRYEMVTITQQDFVGHETDYYKMDSNVLTQCESGETYDLNTLYYSLASDELLTISALGNRNKIYIGDNDNDAGTFIITNSGLKISCGTWDN